VERDRKSGKKAWEVSRKHPMREFGNNIIDSHEYQIIDQFGVSLLFFTI